MAGFTLTWLAYPCTGADAAVQSSLLVVSLLASLSLHWEATLVLRARGHAPKLGLLSPVRLSWSAPHLGLALEGPICSPPESTMAQSGSLAWRLGSAPTLHEAGNTGEAPGAPWPPPPSSSSRSDRNLRLPDPSWALRFSSRGCDPALLPRESIRRGTPGAVQAGLPAGRGGWRRGLEPEVEEERNPVGERRDPVGEGRDPVGEGRVWG